MAHQLLKPYSILLYLLGIVAGFFIGLATAAITDAAKGQMLAGGAIIVFYGLIGCFLGLFLSFIIAYKSNRKVIVGMNLFYLLAIMGSFGYLIHNKQQRDLERQQKSKKIEQQHTPAEASGQTTKPMAKLMHKTAVLEPESNMGLGMFTPNFYENKTLYFYGNLTQDKSVHEHMPIDSITFKQSEFGGFDIATAPPWLVPEHLKLDYDLLYFTVTSISHDFIEVVVNKTENQTAFVGRFSGKVHYWPEFLLNVHSVEFIELSKHKVYSRPFNHAGIVEFPYRFLRPLKIENEWMYTALLGDDFKEVARGWIRWNQNGQLLITYSLLS